MPLRVRKAAPFFRGNAIVDGRIKEISLSDYQGQYLVLLFYPMDFTYVSPTEILAFSDRAKEFYHYNCSIVGLSTDSEFTHLAWMKLSREEGGLGGEIDIALLSDKSMKISKDYGVLDRDTGISHRGLYIIDTKTIIRHITMNDLEVGRSVEETLRLVRAFQFTDKYIKVCPVDWKPGERGLRPNHQQTGRYFEGYFGIARVNSNIQIKKEQPPLKQFELAKRPINEERVEATHSEPANNINLSKPKFPSVNRENISELESSILSEHRPNVNVFSRHDKIVEETIDSVRDYSLSGQYSYPESYRNYLQDNMRYNEELKPNQGNKKGRSYTLYSTTLPNNIILRNENKNLSADIQTTSKSDTTQKYNYQNPPTATYNTDSINKSNSYRKEEPDSKAYLQDSHLKQYIYSYYNTETGLNPNIIKNTTVSKVNHSDKYDVKNDEILKYNERIAKEQELSKARQSNQDKRESSSFNKNIRKFSTVSKVIQNVKDMKYHPLNNVLNIKPLPVNNSSPNIDHNPGGKYHRGNHDDPYSESNRPKMDYGSQETAQEYISERRRSAQRGQSDTPSHSSRENLQHHRHGNRLKPDEANQRQPPQSNPMTLKSSLKRPFIRQANTLYGGSREGRKPHQMRNMAGPQFAPDERSNRNSHADYVDGERRAGKDRGRRGRDVSHIGGMKPELNYGLNGHLII